MAFASDYMDAPTTTGRRSKLESWGYFYFKNGLRDAPLEFVEPSAKGNTELRIIGAPIRDAAGNPVGVVPFLQPKPNLALSAPAKKLFSPTVMYGVRCVRYCGPKPEMEKGDDGKDHRAGPPQVHLIDDWPPALRKQWFLEGRQPPPTCFDLLLAKAPSVVAQNPKYRAFFQAGGDSDYNNALRRAQTFWFIQGICIGHGKVDCSPDSPLPCLHLLTYTAANSLLDLVYAEREQYVYPDGANHELIAARSELKKRFANPDLTDPDDAPVVIITKHENKRRSEKAMGGEKKGEMAANKYVTTISNNIFSVDPVTQASLYMPPEEIFWYPTPQEAFGILINHSPSKDWTNFLLLLAKGTDIELKQESTAGVDVEDSPARAEKQAETTTTVNTPTTPEPKTQQGPAASEVAPGPVRRTLALGNLQKPSNAPAAKADEESHDMPMPDGTTAAKPTDDPAKGPSMVEDMKKKLAAMRQATSSPQA